MIKNTILISCIISLSLLGGISAAQSKQENTFKNLMQGMLIDSLKINKAIFLDDFSTIEISADNIANHPKPAMRIRKKIMMNLGTEMATFKQHDTVVHNIALEISKAAKAKNMPLVTSNYQRLTQGCLSCHSQFKQRVSEILK